MKSGGVFHGNKSGPLKNQSFNDATSCSNVSQFTTNIKGMFTLSGYALKICSVLQKQQSEYDFNKLPLNLPNICT